ncbi:MAG TPA: CsbD family protein [Methylophilaceae bacterium]|jgi:uncharacterized protein YjbJ (UPF0337 family)
MNKDQIKGAAKNLGGKIQEQAGKIVGSNKEQAKGLKTQAEGRAQQSFGNLKQDIKDAYKH